MTSKEIDKIRKSWEKYQAQIKEWLSTGKYEEWQLARPITNFADYAQEYVNMRAYLKLRSEHDTRYHKKAAYYKKENITRHLLKRTLVYTRTTIGRASKVLDISYGEAREKLKNRTLDGKIIWDILYAASDEDEFEASYWYETILPPTYHRKKITRGKEKQLTSEYVYNIIFGDLHG